ncbi:nuclear pore glycoprotein p62-like isoform X1 [Monodelphis domestica]|uniref:Nuclear pore glycoprotein p62 n=2 Tax=Monodelphis domestica TaxID=13616 RepID=A0A5F8G2Y9_MONDO|nr:nuclear pore glycoprotein p62-like isoform X1 [Monodelphis domestica]
MDPKATAPLPQKAAEAPPSCPIPGLGVPPLSPPSRGSRACSPPRYDPASIGLLGPPPSLPHPRKSPQHLGATAPGQRHLKMFRWPFVKGQNTPPSPVPGPGDLQPMPLLLDKTDQRANQFGFGIMSQFNFGGSPATGGGFTFGPAKTTTTTPGPAFSFSTPGSGGGFNFGTPSQPTASTPATSLFSLSTPASTTQTPGFSFGSQATPTPATPGFSLGLSTPKLNLGSSGTPLSSGISGSFGLGNSTLTNSLASNVSSQASTPTGFIFGPPTTTATQSTSSIGFSFSSGNTSQVGTTGFNLGSMGNTSQPTALTGLTFPAATPASTQPHTPFSLGGQSTGLGFGLLASTGSTAIPTGSLATSFNQGSALAFGSKLSGLTPATSAPTTTSGPTLFASIGNSSLPLSSAPSLSVGTPSTSVGAPGLGVLGFGLKLPGSTSATTSTTTTTTSTSTPAFSLNLKPLATAPGIGAAPSTSAALPSTSTTPGPTMDQDNPPSSLWPTMDQDNPPSSLWPTMDQDNSPSSLWPTMDQENSPPYFCISPVMTYAQLESLINKWSLELEDQEKHFLHQATQVNAWDRTLIENGEKITTLHREVEKVKLDQKRLDQELDFILSQQKELEDLLAPLEEAVKEQSGTIYLQHADEEREKTYKLAENIDAQLKRMAQDLKDIIEHLNMSGGPPDTNDPLQQICKILNAHMDSLQWIDQNSALLQRKVEEVSKVCDSRRKEQERSYRIVFD